MKSSNLILCIAITGFLIFFSGCAGSGSGHSTVYHDRYYDPHPHWGYGDDTTVIIDLPERPGKPSKPPGIRPPGGKPPGIGRPAPSGRRR